MVYHSYVYVHEGYGFGDVLQQPHDADPGDTVYAKFVSAHPRNNLETDNSYLFVEYNLASYMTSIISFDD